MDNRFFTLETEARNKFYQIPKVFMMEESKYFNMHPMTKLLYGILADRNSVSIKNGWVDELNRVYFIFNQSDIAKVIGVKDTKTIRKYIKELESYGLLYRKRQGLNLPDRLYLLQTEVAETLANQLMGKNSLSGQGNIPYQDEENFPTSNTNKSNTKRSNTNRSSSSEDDDNLVDRVMKHCQKCNFKLQRKSAVKILRHYDVLKIIRAITTISELNIEIRKPSSYLMAVLNDMDKPKQITIEKKETKPNFNNYNQREYDMDDLERKLLGWD